MGTIAVVGSINMDIVNRVNRLPVPGETIRGLEVMYSSGGKGANQAVAASLSGGDVMMVGAVGEDGFGEELIQTLQSYSVDTRRVIKKQGSSGLAFITVDSQAENTIILSDGANGELSVYDVESSLLKMDDISVILLQNEIPWATTYYTIQEAHRRGIRVVLNMAPVSAIPLNVFSMLNVLIVNESEVSNITGINVKDVNSAEFTARKLLQLGVKSVVITLGVQGSLYMDSLGGVIHTPAFEVHAVDTTAAGDTFVGTFAVAIDAYQNPDKALKYATAASALTVARHGAQSSMPTRDEILDYLHTTSGESF